MVARAMPRLTAVAIVLVLALTGCGDDEGDTAARETGPAGRDAAPAERDAAPAPPDGGTERGHGADPSRVVVPRRDPTPPEAVIALAPPGGEAVAEATQPPGEEPEPVRLQHPRLRGTTVGRDRDGGVHRVRVSITERITCSADGRTFERLRTRYFPPPQVGRAAGVPGARTPTERTRSVTVDLALERCEGAEPVAVEGELWGEAVNGTGLEAVTRHIPFTYEAGG
jgi:hypothetical protein